MNDTKKTEIYFKGPESYQESDKTIFQGRRAETQQILRMVEHSDWCVCYARSGEGKSSLINAGLKPALREQQMFPISIGFEVDKDGYLQDVDFDDFIWKIIESYDDLFYTDSLVLDSNQIKVEKLWWKLRSKIFRVKSEDSIFNAVIPVLIFDQFEEVFTKPHNLQWTYKFFKWLEELYRDEIPSNKEDEMPLGFCEHSLPKKFKALFSLRNEYVSELDYWSMERFFIPSLKNNRYYLKPLTITASKDVVKQLTNWPQDLGGDDVIKVATDEKYQFVEEKENQQKQSSACVSALILSLVLSKLESSDGIIKQRLLGIRNCKNKEEHISFIEYLLDNIYEEALRHCGIGPNSSLCDRLEEILLDDNGRRKQTRKKDLPKDLSEIVNQLEIDRIVYTNNGNIELSHDCICATVARHRTKRLKQLEKQRETAFLTPMLILCFIASIFGLMAIFDETTLLYLEEKKTQIVLWALNAFNILFIPLFIVACVRKVKNARWMSFSFICNLSLLLLLWKNESLSTTNIFSIVATFLALVLSLYAWYNNKNFISPFFKNTIKSQPFIIYLFSILFFAFLACAFGDFYSVSLYSAYSVWGIIVLPPLGCFITAQMFAFDRFSSGCNFNLFSRLKKYMPQAIYISVLCLLAGDIAFMYHSIPPFFISILVISVLLYYLCFYFKNLSLRKRTIASITNFIFFLGVFIASLGYNPLRINYDSAKTVFTWSLVYTLADNGKWGILDAINGDTIISCVMERENISSAHCDVKVKTFDESIWSKSNSNISPSEKTIDSLMLIINSITPDSSYIYDYKNHVATGRFFVNPKMESLLRKKESVKVREDTLVDFIDIYSAKVYKELREANLQYLLKGKSYTINDIQSFHKLDSLQFKNYESALESTLGSSGAANITDTEFFQVNRSLARTFLLCVIRDKINRQDFKSLFTMVELYTYVFFAEEASWNMDFKGQCSLSPDGETITKFHINGKDFKDKAYSYYYMYLQIVTLDILASVSNVATLFRELSFDDFYYQVSKDLDELQSSVIKREHDKWERDTIQYIKEAKMKVDQLISNINRLHVGYDTDDSFDRINKETSKALVSYIEKNPMSLYNMGLVRILQALYSSGFYRGYDMNENVAKVGALVDKNKVIKQMKEYGEVNNMMKERKERLKTISNIMQVIIKAGQKPESK